MQPVDSARTCATAWSFVASVAESERYNSLLMTLRAITRRTKETSRKLPEERLKTTLVL